jgi:hypothetical protein
MDVTLEASVSSRPKSAESSARAGKIATVGAGDTQKRRRKIRDDRFMIVAVTTCVVGYDPGSARVMVRRARVHRFLRESGRSCSGTIAWTTSLTQQSIRTTVAVALEKTDAGVAITAVHLNRSTRAPCSHLQAFGGRAQRESPKC